MGFAAGSKAGVSSSSRGRRGSDAARGRPVSRGPVGSERRGEKRRQASKGAPDAKLECSGPKTGASCSLRDRRDSDSTRGRLVSRGLACSQRRVERKRQTSKGAPDSNIEGAGSKAGASDSSRDRRGSDATRGRPVSRGPPGSERRGEKRMQTSKGAPDSKVLEKRLQIKLIHTGGPR